MNRRARAGGAAALADAGIVSTRVITIDARAEDLAREQTAASPSASLDDHQRAD